jgi:hypothetical protein
MFFKVYTGFYLLLYLYITFSPKVLIHYGVWEWVDVVVMLTALSGMVAYAFQLRLLSRKFWDYYLYFFIIFELVYMTWLQVPLIQKLELQNYAGINNVINAIMMLPIGFALFRLQQQWEVLFNSSEQTS